MSQGFGLIAAGRQIPLEGVRIEAKLEGLCSRVTVTHRYHNQENVDVEAIYVFPLEEGSAVCGFRARVGEKLVEGVVKEKEKAFDAYDDAMAEGHGAFLLDQERPNIFTASVGNLKANQSVEVEVTYVAMLSWEGTAARFSLPTTISPRYTPASGPEVGQPDAERINPPRLSEVPYGLTLKIDAEMGSRIRVIESPSHTVRSEIDGQNATVTLSSRNTALDRDFVLLIEPAEAHKPSSVVAQEEDGTRVVMVNFAPGGEDMPTQSCNELIFVLDCSGSMYGDSIAEARRALELCVRAMSEGDTFNIYRFGSSFTSLWKGAQPYNDQTLKAATDYIRASDADLGGTEILAPLKSIYQQPTQGGRPRQILLLTDGQVSNENQVIALCTQNAENTRVFSFGIGAGVSEHLVRGIARGSHGAAEFIYPGERIEPKVLRMFNRVATPSLQDIRLDWGGAEVEQSPQAVHAIFGGDCLTVFGRISHGQTSQVTLRAGEHTWTVPVDTERATKESAIPVLWARHMIRDLEQSQGRQGSNQNRGKREERRKKKIIDLGVRYKLMSSETSFVAVEVRSESEKTQTQAQLRQVPSALTKGWGGTQGMLPAAASAPSRRRGSVKRKAARPIPTGAYPAPAAMAPPAPPLQSNAAMAPPAPPGGAFGASLGGGRRKSAQKASQGFFQSVKEKLLRAHSPMSRMEFEDEVASEGQEDNAEVFASAAPAMDFMENERVVAREETYAGECDELEEEPVDFDLFELLLTQNANGSFAPSAVLKGWIGDDWSKVEEATKTFGEDVVLTAVAVRLLELRLSESKGMWSGAARKARAFLGRASSAFNVYDLF